LVVNAHVGAGEGPPVVVAMGARVRSLGPGWGGYTVDAAALRRGAGVEHDTIEPDQAYSGLPRREPTRYRPGWPGD
jgi:hypothetical protein